MFNKEKRKVSRLPPLLDAEKQNGGRWRGVQYSVRLSENPLAPLLVLLVFHTHLSRQRQYAHALARVVSGIGHVDDGQKRKAIHFGNGCL